MSVDMNQEQTRAAETLDRPVLVTAGAGSGKTRMLTERYVNAVSEARVPGWDCASVDEVVAITFTDKAAGEIAERVRGELREAGDVEASRRGDLWISTIHGLCSRILRRHPFEAGVDPLFRVADAVSTGRLRERAFEEAVRRLSKTAVSPLELLDLYGFNSVYSAVKSIAGQLAVAGIEPVDIELEPVRATADLHGEAVELFRSGVATCDTEYQGSSLDPVEHSIRCEAHLRECGSLISGQTSDRELLEGLISTLSSYKPLKSLKGLGDLSEELLERRRVTIGAVAAALVAPMARVFVSLLDSYMAIYREYKAEVGMLDFEDLQVKAVELLTSGPEMAQAYSSRFKVVMIDEFQDTDALQLRLVKALSAGKLCTVGDEMQSIYRFRGADVDVYRRHREEMRTEGALVVKLATNYRSHPDLLGFVNEVFESSEYDGSTPTRLEPSPGGRGAQDIDECLGQGPRVEALFVDITDVDSRAGVEREAREIALRLEELRLRGMRAGHVAILLGSYTQAHIYADALTERGIPASVVGGSRFFGLAEITTMRALTRVIANVHDNTALGVLLVADFIPISDDALLRCKLAAEAKHTPLWEMLVSGAQELDKADREAALRLIAVVDAARERVGRHPLENVLLRAVEESGWDLRLISGGNMGLDAFANVLKFARRAASFEGNEGSGPAGFSAHLEAKERFGEGEAPASLADDESDAVRIMSIHASKGLEFPVVVVPRLASSGRNDSPMIRTSRDGSSLRLALKTYALSDEGGKIDCSEWFDLFERQDKLADEQESDRVLYVALTRARDLLMVSGVAKLRPKKASTANNHLMRLSRILGLASPVDGPCDQVVEIGQGVPCRVRVVQVDAQPPGQLETTDADVDAPPPPVGCDLDSSIDPSRPPSRLSYTQLSEFEHCPRRFRIRRVLGIMALAVAVPGQADPLRFGTALHAALRLVGRNGEPPAERRIRAIASFFELDEPLDNRLVETVARYCASAITARVAQAERVIREAPLTLMIGNGLFLLVGSIDLYATSDEAALIVDYKSGTIGEPSELTPRYRLQADCYALAALRDGRSSVEVVFVRPEVDRDGDIERVCFTYTRKDEDALEASLVTRYREIEASEYPPLPGDACRHCEVPTGMCEHRSMLGG